MGTIEEHFQHLNILCLPKLYSFSVGKCMHSSNGLQIILMNILFHLAQFIITPQDQQPLETCFYLELTLPQENVLLNVLAQKYGLQYQTILNFQPPLPLNGNLRKAYMKKIPNYELQQHFPSLVQNKILCILVFCNSVYFLCVFTFSYFLCAYSMLSGMKYRVTQKDVYP